MGLRVKGLRLRVWFRVRTGTVFVPCHLEPFAGFGLWGFVSSGAYVQFGRNALAG